MDVIPLSQVSLSEVTFQDAFQPGCGRRHSRGLLLRVAQAASLADELSAEAESLLHGRLGSSALLAPRREVLLAAEDAQQHAAWLSELCTAHPHQLTVVYWVVLHIWCRRRRLGWPLVVHLPWMSGCLRAPAIKYGGLCAPWRQHTQSKYC